MFLLKPIQNVQSIPLLQARPRKTSAARSVYVDPDKFFIPHPKQVHKMVDVPDFRCAVLGHMLYERNEYSYITFQVS